MLTLDLQRLRDEPIDVGAQVPADDPLWEGFDVDLAVPLEVTARAELTSSLNVWVRGAFEARLNSACRRCLEPLEVHVVEEFEMLFDPDVESGDEDFTLYRLDPKADELDLGTPMRERLLLKLPAFPVCRPECRGMCAQCGAELNSGDCGCSRVEMDPRWGPLLELRGTG